MARRLRRLSIRAALRSSGVSHSGSQFVRAAYQRRGHGGYHVGSTPGTMARASPSRKAYTATRAVAEVSRDGDRMPSRRRRKAITRPSSTAETCTSPRVPSSARRTTQDRHLRAGTRCRTRGHRRREQPRAAHLPARQPGPSGRAPSAPRATPRRADPTFPGATGRALHGRAWRSVRSHGIGRGSRERRGRRARRRSRGRGWC